MCRELKVPAPPEIMIGLKVHDHNGVLTFDDVQRGHSWTRNFWNTLFAANPAKISNSSDSNFGAGYISDRIEGGSISNYPWGTTSQVYFHTGSVGSSSYGIVVGTGDTAFSVEQFALATKITSGNAATQLAYSAGSSVVAAYTAGTKTWAFTMSRVFNNNSGSSITVKEAGIMGIETVSSSAVLQERSVLSPTVAVANGAQLTVTYEISQDFSAIDSVSDFGISKIDKTTLRDIPAISVV